MSRRRKRKKRPSRRPSERRLDSVRAAVARLRRPGLADGPPVLGLMELVREFGDPGGELARLLARDPDKRVSDEARMMLFLAAQEPSVPGEARDRIGRSATPVLLDAMRDASVPDERKYHIGPLLEVFGVEFSAGEYRSFFRDFDRTAEEMNREMMRRLPDGTEFIEMALVEAGLIRHDGPARPTEEDFTAALNLGTQMYEASSDAAAAFLTTTAAIAYEHAKAAEFRGTVLDRVADMRSGRVAWFLGELGRLPGTGPLGEKARDLSAELARAGVAPGAPGAGEFSHGLVSTVDGAGNRSLMLFYRTSEGDLDALALLLNDRVGVKDVWCVFGNAADLDQEVRNRSDQVAYATCEVAFARELVADAMAIHEDTGRPFPGRFLLYRHYLGSEAITPHRRAPNLGAYMLETFVRGPELVEASEQAFHEPIYGRLWCGSDEAYEFVRRFMPERLQNRKGSLAALAMPENTFEEFVAEVASKERETLARRMAANLEVEALAGRAAKPANRAAARVWIALTENIVPFEEMPFIRLLCQQSVSAIFTNLRRGHESQEEANSARLVLEEEAAQVASSPLAEEW